MSIGKFFLKRAASHFGMNEALSYLDLMERIGQPSSVSLPPDLLPMAGKMFTRAAANQMAFQVCRDWVLPYWAHRQYTPGDPAFIPRMGWASFNLTHRNWTAVGEMGEKREITVDPRGLITPWFEGWSLDFWAANGPEMLFPSQLGDEAIRQTAVEDIPIIATEATGSGVRLFTDVFATKIKKRHVVLIRARLENASVEPEDLSLFVAVRPFNPEGLYEVRSVDFKEDQSVWVNGGLGFLCMNQPSRVFACDFRKGDCSHFLENGENSPQATCDVGLASGFAEYRFRLAPGAAEEVMFLAPANPIRPKPKVLKQLHSFDYRTKRNEAVSSWTKQRDQGLQIKLPDKNIERFFNLHKCYLNLMDDGSYITPGPSTYHHYWFRDSAYMVSALDKLGYATQAAQKLENYPSRQKRDGFFLSQDGEWDSNGQAIWTLVEHFRMTGDQKFLRKVFPSIAKGAYWFEQKTAETKEKDSPHKGLLPAGFSAEHFGPNDYFYWDDFWALAGLRDAAYAAEVLGHREKQVDFLRIFDQLSQDLYKSFEYVEEKLGLPIMPASPYRRVDAGAIGNMSALYPLNILSPDDPLIINTVDQICSKCFYKQGFFQDMIHAGVNAYLTFHVAQVLAAQRNPQAWELADYIISLATPAKTWPEAVNVNTGGGAMGDGMHGWATADFLLFVRNALINENGDRLVITPCLPKTWRKWGNTIEVKNAPTHFGDVSFTVQSNKAETILHINANWRKVPQNIEWAIPVTMPTCIVDGQSRTIGNEGLLVPPGTKEVRIGNHD